MNRFTESLKSARESRGISIQDISKQTRINPKLIEAIEEGNFKILPQTYVRAFIRAYAKCVELNPEKIIEIYQQTLSGKAEPPAKNIKQPEIQNEVSSSIPQQNLVSSHEETPIKKLEEYLASIKTSDKPIESEKLTDASDNHKPKESVSYPPKKISISGILIIIIFLLFTAIFVVFYFSPKKEGPVEEQPFENVVKENISKYSPKKIKDSLENRMADSNNMKSVLKPDSLNLALLTDVDTWISVRMDNIRSDRTLLPANIRKTYYAKDRFVVTAGKGKNLKIFLGDKYLGYHSLSDSTRSSLITAEGMKPIKIEKKTEPPKADELKPLEIKPIN